MKTRPDSWGRVIPFPDPARLRKSESPAARGLRAFAAASSMADDDPGEWPQLCQRSGRGAPSYVWRFAAALALSWGLAVAPAGGNKDAASWPAHAAGADGASGVTRGAGGAHGCPVLR